MPSPFPGMDPFIEPRRWRGFHQDFLIGVRQALVTQLRPRYIVEIEERVYLEHGPPEGPAQIVSDGLVIREAAVRYAAPPSEGTAVAPVWLTLPIPVRQKEIYVTLRRLKDEEIVTVIEMLSPTNKRRGTDGRTKYLRKREAVLLSPSHLVELDLLRGGERLPTVEPLPPADFYAFVSREGRRPRVEVYPWTLRDRLPAVPVPLADGDADAVLPLQEVFTMVYDRAGYDYALRYDRPVEPPLVPTDAEWVQQLLAARSASETPST